MYPGATVDFDPSVSMLQGMMDDSELLMLALLIKNASLMVFWLNMNRQRLSSNNMWLYQYV